MTFTKKELKNLRKLSDSVKATTKCRSQKQIKDSDASNIVAEIKKAYPQVQIRIETNTINGKHSTRLHFSNHPKGSNWEKYINHLFQKYVHNKSYSYAYPNKIVVYDSNRKDSKCKDKFEKYEIRWVDLEAKRKGLPGANHVDTYIADSYHEALEKLATTIGFGLGTANMIVTSMRNEHGTYQRSGKLSDLLKSVKDSKCKDADFGKVGNIGFRIEHNTKFGTFLQPYFGVGKEITTKAEVDKLISILTKAKTFLK